MAKATATLPFVPRTFEKAMRDEAFRALILGKPDGAVRSEPEEPVAPPAPEPLVSAGGRRLR